MEENQERLLVFFKELICSVRIQPSIVCVTGEIGCAGIPVNPGFRSQDFEFGDQRWIGEAGFRLFGLALARQASYCLVILLIGLNRRLECQHCSGDI